MLSCRHAAYDSAEPSHLTSYVTTRRAKNQKRTRRVRRRLHISKAGMVERVFPMATCPREASCSPSRSQQCGIAFLYERVRHHQSTYAASVYKCKTDVCFCGAPQQGPKNLRSTASHYTSQMEIARLSVALKLSEAANDGLRDANNKLRMLLYKRTAGARDAETNANTLVQPSRKKRKVSADKYQYVRKCFTSHA